MSIMLEWIMSTGLEGIVSNMPRKDAPVTFAEWKRVLSIAVALCDGTYRLVEVHSQKVCLGWVRR
jgi:hypothetical protein